MIYLDNAATTKIDEAVLNEVIYYSQNGYGNASSKHSFGKQISHEVEEARLQVASLLNCNPNEITFTSGATESINMALKGFVESNLDKGNHIITTATEHKATLETCNYLESLGIEVTYLKVNSNGLIDLNELENSITPSTLLVSIIWVNNETGVIQDLKKIGQLTRKHNITLFTDATQVVGKLPVDVRALNIDMLSLSGHKFHGPKGIGAVFISDLLKVNTLLHGGSQENDLRSGTLNTPGIIGLGKACEISEPNSQHVQELKDYFESKLLLHFDCSIIGSEALRSPYISNVLFKGIDADVIIGKLKETIVSTGSACTSSINEPSHVLLNMGIDNQEAFGSIRFSFSKFTTKEEIDGCINELLVVIKSESLSITN